MRTFNLAIPEDVAQQLERLAERDFRRPRDQAALLLVQAICRALDVPPRSEGNAERPIAKPRQSRQASRTAARTDALDRVG